MLSAQKKFAKSPEPIEENSNGIFFTAEEWEYLKKEIAKQIDEGTHVINYKKAINNARYLAMLDESIQQIKEGKVVTFTDEEWEKFVNEQNLLG